MACEHNNWLYRSGLDPLSVTNLCYGKNISYTELAFLIPFFFKNFSVKFLKQRFYYYLFFKRRKAAYYRYFVQALKFNLILESKLDLLSKIFFHHIGDADIPVIQVSLYFVPLYTSSIISFIFFTSPEIFTFVIST